MDEEPSPTFSQHGLRNFRPRTKPFSCYGTYTSTTDKSAQTLDAFTTLRYFSSTRAPIETHSSPIHQNSNLDRHHKYAVPSDCSNPYFNGKSSSYNHCSSSTDSIVEVNHITQNHSQELSRAHAIPSCMQDTKVLPVSREAQISTLNLTNLSELTSRNFSTFSNDTSTITPKRSVNSSESEGFFISEPLRYFQDEDSEDSGEARVAMNIPEPMDANRASDAAWYEKENLRLQKLLNLSNSTVNTLSSELSRAQFHIIELNSRNKESTTKQDDLINKLKSVTLRCIQAERLLQNTSTDNASLTQQLARVEVENERLASEIVLLRKQDFEGWNQSPHRRQVKERASLANAQLESALNDARAGIQALLKGVESAKRVSKILASIDNFYTESNDSCCSSPSGSDPSLST